MDLTSLEGQDAQDMEMNSSSGNSFKEIVMIQLRKVTINANVEFRGGYYTMNPLKGSNAEKEIYVQDSREVYNNGVYALCLILSPKFDKKMTASFEDFKEKSKSLEQKFIDKSSVDEEVVLGEDYYTNEKDKILLETYKMKKLRLHLNLFAKCCELLGRLNYMEILGGTF